MGALSHRGLTVGVLAVTLLGTSGARAASTGSPPTGSASAGPALTALLSVATDGTQGNADSFDPCLSADGSTVAFASLATNLAATGPVTAMVVGVFARDQRTGRTVRISDPPGGAAANGDSRAPAVSGDGSVLAFESRASNLVAGDGNGASDVFVWDRASGRTSRVSVASDGGEGNGDSGGPSISADGRFVAFASEATGLVPGDHNRAEDVFVHDRRTGKTIIVSVTPDDRPGNGNSFSPAISAGGRFVAFASEDTNLVRGDTNGDTDIFVRDLATGRTARVSLGQNGAQVNGDVFSPSISGDGRFVAFATDAGNVTPGDGNRAFDVFVHDAQTGRTTLVGAGHGGSPSDRGSFAPSLAADGRSVAFVTDAPLVAGDTNGTEDVYVADVAGGGLRRVSVASDGSEGDQPSTGPSLSGDGGTVAFESLATDLVVADSNGAEDVFWHR
jgi:Tol biopolymer transport system component